MCKLCMQSIFSKYCYVVCIRLSSRTDRYLFQVKETGFSTKEPPDGMFTPPPAPPLRLLLFALFHFSLPTCTCQLAAAGSHCSYNVNWTLFHKEDIKCYLTFHFYFNKKICQLHYVLNCTDLETLQTINSSLHQKLDQRHEIERDISFRMQAVVLNG